MDVYGMIKWILNQLDKLRRRNMRILILNPADAQDIDGEICLEPSLERDIIIKKIKVTLDAAANEVAGDLKFCDAFIGQANAEVINDFDTTSGVRNDDSITLPYVAAGKCLYIAFDSQPAAVITQMCMRITYVYD